MRTKLFITCMIMTLLSLLSMITLTSCSSSIDDTLTESEFAIDDLSPNFNCESPQEMINTLTLTFNVTPTVIIDSCELFATRNEIDFTASAHSSTYTVPLNSNRTPDGMYSVHFKVRNVTVRYRIENPAWFPTAPGSIDFEVEVNKNATNTIKIEEASVSGIAPRQTLRVSVCITSDEGGSTHTYTVSFLAAIKGAHIAIKDGSRVD